MRIKKILIIVAAISLVGVVVFGAIRLIGQQDSSGDSQVEQSYVEQQRELLNKYLSEGDNEKALMHAKNLQSHDPENLDYKEQVLVILEQLDPKEAQKLRSESLDRLLENEETYGGKPVYTYWTIATEAEQVQRDDIAKEYYQKVINAADISDGNEASLKKKAQEAVNKIEQKQ